MTVATHRCDVQNIDYSTVDSGYLRCRIDRDGCGREWTFVPNVGWKPNPRPVGER